MHSPASDQNVGFSWRYFAQRQATVRIDRPQPFLSGRMSEAMGFTRPDVSIRQGAGPFLFGTGKHSSMHILVLPIPH